MLKCMPYHINTMLTLNGSEWYHYGCCMSHLRIGALEDVCFLLISYNAIKINQRLGFEPYYASTDEMESEATII